MSVGIARTVDAVWRMESARIVATLAKMTGDVGLAEDLAQEAVVAALAQWPESGVPQNAGAWLTAVAKRKAIDGWRRRDALDDRYHLLAHALEKDSTGADAVASTTWESIDDDVLRLVFTACHPVLAREAQVAMTLRVIGGLTTEEIARMFFVPIATVQQRIVRAKKTLSAAHVPFEAPDPHEWQDRLDSVLGVVYLIFTEGYAATSGDRWMRTDVAHEALRIGRILAGIMPRESEVHALVALMEFQASRFGARVGPDGAAVLLADQDRRRWDHAQIRRGTAALARADARGRGRGKYAVQAAIAEVHAVALRFGDTDWPKIVVLYEVLGRIAPSPIVELNRAVAVSMETGPASALAIVDSIADSAALRRSHLLPSVRGELLSRLGRAEEARAEFVTAAGLVQNLRERDVLLAKGREP